MKKIFSVKIFLLLSIMAFGLSSCDIEDSLRDRLMDSRWGGDLGRLADENKEPVYSVFTFESGRRGYEDLYYASDDELYRTDYFSWDFYYDYEDYIVLTYRDGFKEFIDRVRFDRNTLSGIHYLNPLDFDSQRNGMNILLKEEYKGRY